MELTDALVISGCFAAVFFCWSLAAFLWIQRQRQKIREDLRQWYVDWMMSPDEKTPSRFAAELVDPIAILIAARIAQQFRTSLAGMESGEAKAEDAELAAGLATVNPWAGAAMALVPKRLRKKLLNNAQFVGPLFNALGGKGGNGQHETNVKDLHSKMRGE